MEKLKTKKELLKDIERMKMAFELIKHIQNRTFTHLGRPRSSDLTCIFCIADLTQNYGAYGEYLEKEDFYKAIEEIKNGKRKIDNKD